ncbi:MAG: LacI family DNA-binding transcriptional regulator [Treponema sp.]|jgi:LacI family transcriptional regulator|nr:LacI family DNA-binding transcriptional regulator [Treponema sp.]
MANNTITLAQIAERLGVSKITVSRALKGQPGVSDSLRKEARRLASELGYQYERLRSSQDEKGRFIFLVPKHFYLALDVFYHEIYYYLYSLCQAKGMELSVRILEKDAEERGILPEDAASAEGIFIGGEAAEPVLHGIAALRVPCVGIDFNITSGLFSCVCIDNFMIGVIAAEYLYKQGYRKIGFIGSHERTSSASDRIHGLMRVIGQKKLYFRDDWLFDNYDEQTGRYTINVPLPPEMPEAYIGYNDNTAYYFMEFLKSAGYRVPEDAAVIGIDNTSLAASCHPPMTSIEINRYRFAEEALRLMTEQLEGKNAVQRVYLNPAIVERDSTPVRLCV